jgi:hypothetical protein
MKTNWWKALVFGAVLGGLNLAPELGNGAGNGQQKVVICHMGHTLEVAEPAVQAHLNHGDSLGPCNITPNQNP